MDEFDRYRTEMNEKLLGSNHLGIKRYFALDTQAYEDGALDKRTKELFGLWPLAFGLRPLVFWSSTSKAKTQRPKIKGRRPKAQDHEAITPRMFCNAGNYLNNSGFDGLVEVATGS